MTTKNKTSKENFNTISNKNDISSSDFRIIEYKDHFMIQKRKIVKTRFYFLGIPLWVNGEKEEWNVVLKNITFNWNEIDNYKYKTKEECLEWIADYYKYPVYHYC